MEGMTGWVWEPERGPPLPPVETRFVTDSSRGHSLPSLSDESDYHRAHPTENKVVNMAIEKSRTAEERAPQHNEPRRLHLKERTSPCDYGKERKKAH